MNDDYNDDFTKDDADDTSSIIKQVTDEEFGEEDASGSTASLESDDNALDAAQSMGLYANADEEHPVELGLGQQIDDADIEDLEDA